MAEIRRGASRQRVSTGYACRARAASRPGSWRGLAWDHRRVLLLLQVHSLDPDESQRCRRRHAGVRDDVRLVADVLAGRLGTASAGGSGLAYLGRASRPDPGAEQAIHGLAD